MSPHGLSSVCPERKSSVVSAAFYLYTSPIKEGSPLGSHLIPSFKALSPYWRIKFQHVNLEGHNSVHTLRSITDIIELYFLKQLRSLMVKEVLKKGKVIEGYIGIQCNIFETSL